MAIKHNLDADDDLWRQVLIYKIETKQKNNNEAVISLIRRGLKDVRKSR
jgi:hypothetical protein